MWDRGSVAQDEREVRMANPRSDPEMGKDMEDLTKGLEELSESPKEEKSQRALLHSHLEQQHHLICILKKKAGNARKRCRGLEQLNVELENLRTEDAVKMKSQTQWIQHLEKRFMGLAKNHEKMIQFKNEHRKQHTQLWEENKRLQQENETLFSQAVREKEAKVLQPIAQPRKILQRVESLQEKCAYESCRAQEWEKELLEAQSQQVPTAWEVDSLKKQVQRLQEKHQQTLAWVEQAQSQQRAWGSELHTKLERANEKERLVIVAMEKGKALQDKHWEIRQLGKKLKMAEWVRQRAGKRLMTEAAAADNDPKVQELQQQLESSKWAHHELSLQFDAYSKHSTRVYWQKKKKCWTSNSVILLHNCSFLLCSQLGRCLYHNTSLCFVPLHETVFWFLCYLPANILLQGLFCSLFLC